MKEVISLNILKSYILNSKWRTCKHVSIVCVSCGNIGWGNDLDKTSIQEIVTCNKQ